MIKRVTEYSIQNRTEILLTDHSFIIYIIQNRRKRRDRMFNVIKVEKIKEYTRKR